jgi:hypothetical protein
MPCTIYPQIRTQLGETIDSPFFKEGLSALKAQGLDVVQAREKMKQINSFVRTGDFKLKYGDWELLHKMENNSYNVDDNAVFLHLYKGDIELLKNTITIPLNEHNEPKLDYQQLANKDIQHSVELSFDSNIPGTEVTYQNKQDFFKVMSAVTIRRIQDNSINDFKLTDLTSTTVFQTIVGDLEATLAEYQDNMSAEQFDTAMRLFENLQDDTTLWNEFKIYFNRNYNYEILDLSETLDFYGLDHLEIPVTWEDRTQLRYNALGNISNRIKFALSTMYSRTTSSLGLPQLVDYKDLLQTLATVHRVNRITKPQEYLSVLERVSHTLNVELEPFLDRLRTEEGFLEAYISALDLDMTPRVGLKTDTRDAVGVYDLLVDNRDSFIERVDFDRWNEQISINLANGRYGTFEVAEFSITRDMSPKQIARRMIDMGVDISAYMIEDFRDNHTQEEYHGLIRSMNYVVEDILSHRENKQHKYTGDERGNLATIAEANMIFSKNKTKLSYLNINGDIEQTPQYHSYLTKKFKHLNNAKNVFDAFHPFTQDSSYMFSNWLWNDSAKADAVTGIFNIARDKDGNFVVEDGNYKIDENNPVNVAFAKKLQVALFSGNKDISKNLGINNERILNNNWDLTSLLFFAQNEKSPTGKFFIPSADSQRIFMIDSPVNLYDSKENPLFTFDGKVVTGINEKSPLFTMVMKTLASEFADMNNARDILFDINFDDKTKTLTFDIKKEFKTNTGRHKLHPVKLWDGKQILDGTTPTGKVFQFNNLTYKKDGVTHTLNSYMEKKNINPVLLDINDNTDRSVYRIIAKEFVKDALINNANQTINQFQKLEKVVRAMKKHTSKLTTSDVRAQMEHSEKARIVSNPGDFQKLVANYYVANYISQVEIGNFINGKLSEYKGAVDWNKRTSQSIRNGRVNAAYHNTTYTVLAADDIVLPNRVKKDLKDVIDSNLLKDVESTDGFSVITLNEFERRMKGFGMYDNYKALIKDLKDETVPFNPANYSQLLESLKLFSYGRNINTSLSKPMVMSHQFKNSTIVIAPKLVKRLGLESLNEFMDENSIDEVQFKSAVKVGDHVPVRLHNKDGDFQNKNSKNLINASKRTHNYNDLVVQLTVKPHLTDASNKWGVQLEKMILNNLNFDEKIYQIGKQNNKFTGTQIKHEYQSLLAKNILEDSNTVLEMFGALDELGNPNYNSYVNDKGELTTDKNIVNIDRDKLFTFLNDYVSKNEDSENLKKAIQNTVQDGKYVIGQTNLPIYIPVHYKKFVSILLSTFTNNVTNQKFPGIHAPLVPELFINFKDATTSDKDIAYERFIEEGHIEFTQDFRDSRGDFRLRAENTYKDGKLIHRAEVILNRWGKNFFKDQDLSKPIPIDQIPKEAREMLAIKMPTEGKQSMVLLEVVGFLNSGTTQAILPYETVSKMGADYDIDTLYFYTKNTFVNANGEVKIVPFDRQLGLENSREARENRILDIVEGILSNEAHAEEFQSPNTYNNIIDAGNHVNSLWGYELSGLNPYNHIDGATLRNLNMSTRILKANSVAWDGMLSILGATKAYMNEGIEYHVLKSELPADFNHKMFSKVEDRGNYYAITDKHIANNPLGNWRDVQGEHISNQNSEVTANILDAVKFPMGFNINEYTLPVFRLLSSQAINLKYDFGKGAVNNRFIYAYLFTHQPAIVSAVTNHTLNQVTDSNSSFSTALSDEIYKMQMHEYNSLPENIKGQLGSALNTYISEKLAKDEVPYVKGEYLDEINEVLAEYGKNYKATNKTTASLKRAIEVYKDIQDGKDVKPETKAAFYRFQQRMLAEFIEYNDNQASELISAISTFNTDKLGAGPSFGVTYKLLRNIESSIINDETILQILESRKVDEDTAIEILVRYNAHDDLGEKIRYIQDEFKKIGAELPGAFLKVSERVSLVEAIYPTIFDRNADIYDSIYPNLNAYYEFSNAMSFRLFKNLIPFEDLAIRQFKQQFPEAKRDESLDNLLNNYMLSSVSNDIAYFNRAESEYIRRQQEANPNLSSALADRARLFGSKSVSLSEMTDKFTINLEKITQRDIDLFESMSLADKITLIKSNPRYLAYINHPKFNRSHLLNQIKINDVNFERDGYTTVLFQDNNPDLNAVSYSLLDMYHNDNPFVRSIADDLIKMAYWNHGFSFGNNLSKVIPVELLYDETHAKSHNREHKLSDYAPSIRNTQLMKDRVTSDMAHNFYKANWNNSRLVPIGKPVYTLEDGTDNYVIDERFPSFRLLKPDALDTLAGQIIIEETAKIDRIGSPYSKKRYVLVNINKKPVLFKRINISKTEIIYYPINRTLPFEHGETAIEAFKKIGDADIFSEQAFLDAVMQEVERLMDDKPDKVTTTSTVPADSSQAREVTRTVEPGKQLDLFGDQLNSDPNVDNITPTVDTSASWGTLKNQAVYTEKDGKTYVNTMRTTIEGSENAHFGNPFSEGGYKGTIKVDSIQDAIQAYKDWLLEETTKDYAHREVVLPKDLRDLQDEIDTLKQEKEALEKKLYDDSPFADYTLLTNEEKKRLAELEDEVVGHGRTGNEIYKDGLISIKEDQFRQKYRKLFYIENLKNLPTPYLLSRFREIEGEIIDAPDKFKSEKQKNYFTYILPKEQAEIKKLLETRDDVNISTKVEPERREWILEQIHSGKLDGAVLLYDKTLAARGLGSHAHALAEVVSLIRNQGDTQNSVELITDDRTTTERTTDVVNSVDSTVYLGDLSSFEGGIVKTNSALLHHQTAEKVDITSILNSINENQSRTIALLIDKDSTIPQSVLEDAVRRIFEGTAVNRILTTNPRVRDAVDVQHSLDLSEFSIDDLTNQQYIESQFTTVSEQMLHIVELADMYHNKALDYKQELTEEAKQIVDREIVPAVENLNYEMLLEAHKINNKLNVHIVNHISKLYDELKKINLETLKQAILTDPSAKNDIIKKIRTINDLSVMVAYVPELSTLDSRFETDLRAEINAQIEQLQGTYDAVRDIVEAQIPALVQQLFGSIVYAYSRNPKVLNRFNTELKNSGIEDTSITSEEWLKHLDQLFKDNEDLTWIMMYTDSILDTGIPIVDNSMLSFIVDRHEKNRIVDAEVDTLMDEYRKLEGLDAKSEKPFSTMNRSERAIKFKAKFINPKTGNLIGAYDYDAFHDAKSKLYEEFNTLKIKIKGLEGEVVREQMTNPKDRTKRDAYKKLTEQRDNLWIDWYENHQDVEDAARLTEAELAEIAQMEERYAYSKADFAQYLSSKHYERYTYKDKQGNIEETFIKVVPKEMYKDARYDELTDQEKAFSEYLKNKIREIAALAYPDIHLRETFFPYKTAPTMEKVAKQLIGWQSPTSAKQAKGLNNQVYYKLDAPMIHRPKVRDTIRYRRQRPGEDTASYETDIVSEVNAHYRLTTGAFTTLQQIKDLNEQALAENKQKIVDYMDFDPYQVMKQFISQTLTHKQRQDFADLYSLLLTATSDDSFQAIHRSGKGHRLLDQVRAKATKKKTHIRKKGMETRIHQRLVGFAPVLYNVSNVKNRKDQILKVAKEFTSRTYMQFNILGGIKNVSTGYHNMLMEGIAGQFINKEDLNWGISHYPAIKLLAEIGQEHTDNLNVGLIKRFGQILDLKNERGQDFTDGERAQHILSTLNNAAYFNNNFGEHFMQFSMLLANLRSHRVHKGTFMNYNEYQDDIRQEIIESIITEDQKKELRDYIEKRTKAESRPGDYYNHVGQWMGWTNKRTGEPNVTREQRKQYMEKLKERKKAIKAEFEQLPRMIDQYELKDGRATRKADSTIDQVQEALFENRVHKINHQLHGIYDHLNRNLIKNSVEGELALQFRSWMRPNWVRYFGARWGRAKFDEGLGVWQKGAYSSLFDFIGSPFKNNPLLFGRGNDTTAAQALKNLLTDSMELITNLKFHYNILPEHEKANIMRAITNALSVIGLSLSMMLIGRLATRDDEEDIDNIGLAMLIYQANATHAEITQFVPIYGWYGAVSRTVQSPFAAQKVLLDIYKVFQTAMEYPFMSPENRVYDRGVFEGKDVLGNRLARATPIVRQFHKFDNIKNYTNWYRLYNPFVGR